MTKLSRKYIDPANFDHYVNNLWSAFTLMDSKEDIRLLFKDLFTHTEYKMFAKRLEIARRLRSGENYEDIMKALNVTSNTITKINNILAEKGDGLRKADEKLRQLDKKHQQFRENRQAVLERRVLPRYKGGDPAALPKLLKAGVLAIDRSITRGVKRHSARKNLSV
ncbi:MAG: hypothetical protein HY336_01220 [Candidatus Doudnabacteria bacterium]|nr:hypothetical protein [Candidatus Doudnabacteria bacterium]